MPFVRRKGGQVLIAHARRRDRAVLQEVLHRFGSPAELAAALDPAEWAGWTEALAWRHPDLRWDWQRIRAQLEAAMGTWQRAPSGEATRTQHKITALAAELRDALAALSPAHPAGAALLADARPTLLTLNDTLTRLLAVAGKTTRPPEEPHIMRMNGISSPDEAEVLFDAGMEHWWAGNRAVACRYFRRAIERGPNHADAHNHLGIRDLEARRLAAAERHFRTAMASGGSAVVREGELVEWGHLENRPYLRACANLALVLRAKKQLAGAAALHERMLAMNPNDNQGVRYLLAGEHHRLGELGRAVEIYTTATDDAASCFGLGLARHQLGQSGGEVGQALLKGFASNRYLAPMLLGEPWERLDGWHGANMAEPEWVVDALPGLQELWHAVPRSALLLRWWWMAPAVRDWRARLDESMIALKGLPPGEGRSAIVSESFARMSDSAIRTLARKVARSS